MKLGRQENSPARDAFFSGARQLVNDHMDELEPIEVLAIFANLMGCIIAGADIGLNEDELTELINKNMMNGYREMRKVVVSASKAGNA
jgi:hypothetical protein